MPLTSFQSLSYLTDDSGNVLLLALSLMDSQTQALWLWSRMLCHHWRFGQGLSLVCPFKEYDFEPLGQFDSSIGIRKEL